MQPIISFRKLKNSGRILRPDRIRRVERPFGWIPRRLVTSGLLARLEPDEKLLYFFLAAVADKNGISFYGNRRIETDIGLDAPRLAKARHGLIRRNLIVAEGPTIQLLDLPGQPWKLLRTRKHPQARTGCSTLEPVANIIDRLHGHPGHKE